MTALILHHYPTSPFAEKARLMLGFKGLAWQSVNIPPMMPKPDLMPLTGGYRKTPVLQIGADVYCDTALIARQLDKVQPQPALLPPAQEAVVAIFAAWVDSVVFQHAVSFVFQPESAALRFSRFTPEQRDAFLADRARLFSGGSASRLPIEVARHQWPSIIGRVERQLHAGGEFLFGEATYADFALAHCLWFLKATPVTSGLVDSYPSVAGWLQRVLAIGHGTPTELSGSEALAIAKAAQPAALPEIDFVDPSGFKAGDAVTVSAVDYGVDPVAGELVYCDQEEIVVRREEELAGTVHVHFPRLGFAIKAQ
ncbi:glutathione S-transferase family protein [Pseudomonas sp. RIT-PI-S]|uniref:glutathione S-transferase family protein n=1 Tax=Pseudomonas sp. RIT-PI-S TaxID=3035295 RepID=UPI0021DAB201|nr:glutathione S-transferase family protein [Pseudomonas sp. RIT-PI-S]